MSNGAHGDEVYAIRSTDLVVKIGDAPVTPVYELTFESNGGSAVLSVKKEAGTVIDLSSYNPVRNKYDFDGWYSDPSFTKPIHSVVLNANTTIYAKWVEEKVPEDGKTPYIGTNGNWWIGTTDTGVKAEGSNGSNGQNGQDGQDGKTPYIGENGNWWIGNADTGIKAQGSSGNDGQDGEDGKDGNDGKDGVGIKSTEINDNGELVITLSDGKVLNAGKISCIEGKDGIGIQSVVVDDNRNLIVILTDGSVINAGSIDLATDPADESCDLAWIYILLVITVILSNAGWIVLLVKKRKRKSREGK